MGGRSAQSELPDRRRVLACHRARSIHLCVFVHRGFQRQARRKRMLCRKDARRSACGASERRVGVARQPRHSFPSRLAIVCGAKSVPKPTRPGALPSRVSSWMCHRLGPSRRLSAVSACSAVIIADPWAPSAGRGPTRTGTEAHGHTRGRGEGLLGGRGEGAAARTNPTGSSARLWVYCFPLTKSPNGPRSSYLFRQVVYMMPTAPGVWARASSQPRGFSRVSPS